MNELKILTGGTRHGLSTGFPEISNDACHGGYITSGGGFSHYSSAPSFQQDAISSYFSKVSPTQSTVQPYNRSNRGYPDVSMASESFRKFNIF